MERSAIANFKIGVNDANLGTGAQDDGYRPMKGGIDAVRIYNRALSAEEITALAGM